MEVSEQGAVLQMLHFQLQETQLCLDIRHITKIIPLLPLEKVPHSPLWLAGLMNLEEQVFPAIDLAIRLGMPRHKPYTVDFSILMCNYEANQVGLVVDEVIELIEINSTDMQMHEQFDSNDAPFMGSITIKGELFFLLNIKHLFPLNIHLDFKKPV